MVTSANELPEVIEKALREAVSGRPGPVWIDVPLDIQSAKIDSQVISCLEENISCEEDFNERVDYDQFKRALGI